jgi:hypothetical protein
MRKINYKFVFLLMLLVGFILDNQLFSEGVNEQSVMASSLRKAPYLIYPGINSEYTILWQLKETQTSLLKWGSDTTYSMGSINSEEYGDDHQHKYTFTGLTPGNKYYYSVTIDNEEYKGDFYTAPPNDSQSLKFIAYGDTRGGTDSEVPPESHERVASEILNVFDSDPEYQGIITFVGDAVKRGKEEHYWDEQFFNTSSDYSNMQKLRGSVGYQFAVGNHEDVDESDLFEKYFIYPYVNDCYWAFDYGPVRFIMLDQYKASYSAGSAQINWLEDELKTSDKKWKIIILHKTGWSVGHHGSDETTQEVIQPLCEKYGVKILFGGHNHLYARAYDNGVYHITTGGGGASVVIEGDTTEEHLQKVVYKNHFCKIDINDDLLKCDVIDDTGDKIDEFSIKLGACQLITNISGSGTIEMSPPGGSYDEGAEVTLSAVPNEGWKFVSWSGDADGTDSTIVITMDGNKEVTANFSNASSLLTYDGAHATSLQGTIDTENAGYTGDGYANTDNEKGTYIEWNNVTVSDAGTYNCTIRYANGSDNARNGDVEVNGTVADSFFCANTGSFTIWKTEIVTIELNSGINTVRLIGTTDESLGNIDRIDIELIGGSSGSIDIQVSSTSDDAEEHGDESVDFNSSDLELVKDGDRGDQHVGMRFKNIKIPQGAEITNAYIQFTTDEVSEGDCSLIIKGEAADNALAFSEENKNISDRQTTSSTVTWNPEDWMTEKESGAKQKTPDIKTIIQEIVNRSGWSSGNSLAIIVTGSGKRTAESYDGSAEEAPKLHIEYGIATIAENKDIVTIPNTFNLKNYPNPFNPSTKIEFGLPEAGNVKIVIYDMRGREVATIADGFYPAGKYNCIWEAKGDNGALLPSGLYIAVINSGSFKKNIKMLLIK